MWFHSDTSKSGDIYFHYSGVYSYQHSYGAAMVGVATAKSPCGPYTYKGSWKPLGADSRDESLFEDSKLILHQLRLIIYLTAFTFQSHSIQADGEFGVCTLKPELIVMVEGTAYLLYASDNNQNFKVSQLDSNYYNVTSVVTQMNGDFDAWLYESEFVILMYASTGATLEAPGIVKRDGVTFFMLYFFI